MKFQNRVPKYPFKRQYCLGHIYIYRDLFIVSRSHQMFFAQDKKMSGFKWYSESFYVVYKYKFIVILKRK